MVPMWVSENLPESVLSFHLVELRDRIEVVIRLGGRHPYLLQSHLPDLRPSLDLLP